MAEEETPSATDDKKDSRPDDIEAMKAALKKANKEAEDLRKKFKEIEDKDKSESEKLTEKAATAEKRAEEAELRAMRLEVAVTKGLTPKQATRLVGATREEIEADADDFLESIKPTEERKDAPLDKPKERLSGGGDPTEEPAPDLRKVVADIPRSY